MMLVDTDVFIWHYRGLPTATLKLNSLPKLALSAVVWLELLQGFRSKTELELTKKSLQLRKAEILPITPKITDKAIALMESFALGHGLHMGDALIAATALEHNLAILTANAKHFRPIANIKLEKFDPRQPAGFSVHEPRVTSEWDRERKSTEPSLAYL